MSDAQTILRMIEEVDPADTAKLDEIDARVWCFLNNSDPESDAWCFNEKVPNWRMILSMGKPNLYTRSRDALKEIRPDGWYFSINGVINERKTFNATAYKPHPERIGKTYPNLAAWGKTEELAELHAIIQAIDHERSQK